MLWTYAEAPLSAKSGPAIHPKSSGETTPQFAGVSSLFSGFAGGTLRLFRSKPENNAFSA
jgi:hypothetical protein